MDCINGIFPNAETDEDMNEELRCFYVAMTRAISTLDIICPKHAVVYGRFIKANVTPFLLNLGSGYAQTIYAAKGERENPIQKIIDNAQKYSDV